MHALLDDPCARHRPAVLRVAHDVDEAIALADRVLVPDRGSFALDRPVGLRRPRTPGDAQFQALRDDVLRGPGRRRNG